MGEAKRREQIRKTVQAIVKEWADKGMIIEGGFRSLVAVTYEHPEEISPKQMDEMRRVFYAGAQHLFASLVDMMDPDNGPTDNDMRRMHLIQSELDAFIEGVKQRSGLPLEPRETTQ